VSQNLKDWYEVDEENPGVDLRAYWKERSVIRSVMGNGNRHFCDLLVKIQDTKLMP